MNLEEVPVHRRNRVEAAAAELLKCGAYRATFRDAITDANAIVAALDASPACRWEAGVMVVDLRNHHATRGQQPGLHNAKQPWSVDQGCLAEPS